MLKKTIIVVLAILLIAFVFSPFLARFIESKEFNQVRNWGPYSVSPSAKELHDSLLVADLHADPLLWSRDLTQEWNFSHFDLPRMQKANLSLQVFGLVTKTPRGQNFNENSADTDNLIPLSIMQHWPVKTWNSPLERAIYQSGKLENLASSDDNLTVLRNLNDLNQWLINRKKTPLLRAGLLGIEGAHALEANLNNFDRLYKAGVRMIGMAHFFDNHFSASAHGISKGGLSDDGKELVKLAQEKGVIIDIAHTAPKAIDDVFAISKKPIVVSHTGVKATCNSPRNLSDRHIKKVAQTGGLVAIAIFKTATCGNDINHMIDAIDHVVKLVGVDYVGLGLDLDGAITSPVDVTGMPLITQELLKRGYSVQEIAKISGMNFIRVLKHTLQ